MLPLLELYADGKIYHRKEFIEKISEHFSLTEAERLETIKSGRTRIWDRVYWAAAFLKNTELVNSPKKGFLQITPRGQDLLSKKLKTLTVRDLELFYPDILETKFFNPELRDKKSQTENIVFETSLDSKSTPDELLDQIIDQKLAESYSEIVDQIKNISPRAFETLVVKLLVAMGYGSEKFSQTTSYTNDGGIDGIIQADKLGFEKIYVQAKKYEGNIGRPEIQKFIGAMTGTSKGVFITTSDFSHSVEQYLNSRQENVILINGSKLAELMFEFNQGVTVRKTIEIKTLDTDYFEELEG